MGVQRPYIARRSPMGTSKPQGCLVVNYLLEVP
jgi:hypothetical protein